MQNKKLYREIRKVNNNMRSISHSSIHGGRNLSHAQINIIDYTSKNPGVMQKDIAERMGIKPSSVTEVLKKLEEKDYILRLKDENDLRKIRIYITLAGEKELEKIKNNRDQHEEMIFNSLTEDEKDTLYDLLRKINMDLEKLRS